MGHDSVQASATNKSKIKRKIHKGEKPFACKFCKKVFTARSTCKQHEKIHTGYDLFSCKYCNKKYTSARSYIRHKSAIHPGDERFSCTYCNRTFAYRGTCEKHEKTHSQQTNIVLQKEPRTIDSSNHIKMEESNFEATLIKQEEDDSIEFNDDFRDRYGAFSEIKEEPNLS